MHLRAYVLADPRTCESPASISTQVGTCECMRVLACIKNPCEWQVSGLYINPIFDVAMACIVND